MPENINYKPSRHTPQLQESPFGGIKTSPENIQFSIDPSQGLTRKRYGWYSNGSLFDSALFSEVEAGIRLETTATGSDIARIRSAYPGQYISQAVAQPGLGAIIDASNVEISPDGLVSLSHGEVYMGAYYWDEANNQVDTGVGYKWDASGWVFFIKSRGQHIGPSPVSQSEFGVDTGDGDGHSGRIIDPSLGFVYNFPFTWYNEGVFSGAWLNPTSNHIEELVRCTVEGRPSTESGNLPVQLVARNNGTASSLGVEVGGMQYSSYGAGKSDVERRRTDESRVGAGLISVQRTLTENAVDPTETPGDPLVSFQRESGRRDLSIRGTRISLKPIGDSAYVFIWDEWDPSTALTGASFTNPISPNNAGRESHVLTDTQATAYSPTVATFRGMNYFEGGSQNKASPGASMVDLRVPLGATRVYTAVNAGGTAADADPFIATVEEGY